ncbi:MAG: hypothetical protein JNJ57_19615 [Saprospiraceae bacterium]|nr:hypothetical protein [Saprospiraceae bacterium]
MRTLQFFSILIVMLLTCTLSAQNYSIDGVKFFSAEGIKPIMNGKEVGGYIIFYRRDKASEKNDNYGLELLDEKLNKVSTIKVTMPRNLFLLQSVFNGEALGLMFYNPEKKNYIYKSYSKTLTELGSKSTEKPNKWELATLNQMLGGDTDEAFYFFGIRPVEGKGFVRTGYGKSSDQFKLYFYDNTFKQVWAYETPKDAKGFENFFLSDINTQYISGTTWRRKTLLSKKFEYYLTVFDAATGKKLVDVSAENKGQQLSITSTILQPGSNEILLQGEYYNEDDKPGVHKSKGFYIKTFDITTAKETSERLYAWDKEIAKMFDAKGKESIEDKFLNYPHVLIKTNGGKYYMVFEQFKKAADAGGIAMRALGGGTGVAKAKIGNLWVLEMDNAFKPLNIKYFEKDGSDVSLPAGVDMMGAGFVGYFTKWVGGFDYQFLQQSNDALTFNVSYLYRDKEKGEKTQTVAGNVFLTSDGALNFDKVNLTPKSGTKINLFPAKGQALMVTEYNKKAKTVDFKLVKLNY